MKPQKSPKMSPWLHRGSFLFAAALLTSFLGAAQALAFGLDLMGGAFAVEAEAGGKTGNVSNLGAYRLSVGKEIFPKFEAAIGYTLMASDVIGGGMSYGLDFGGFYFPTRKYTGGPVLAGNVQYDVRELWQPYVGAGFHQRQFQSVKSHYAGFGVSAGVLRAISGDLIFKGELRYVMLSGPSSGQASELNIVAGVRIPL